MTSSLARGREECGEASDDESVSFPGPAYRERIELAKLDTDIWLMIIIPTNERIPGIKQIRPQKSVT